jgi:hypothetical protein
MGTTKEGARVSVGCVVAGGEGEGVGLCWEKQMGEGGCGMCAVGR